MLFKRESNSFEDDPEEYKYLVKLPRKKGIFVVLDTENIKTVDGKDIIEIKAYLIKNGDMDTLQFNNYIYSSISTQNSLKIDDICKIESSAAEPYLSHGNKKNLFFFLRFIKNYLIFSHNAPLDMENINRELKFCGMPEIPLKRFRCTLRIFKEIIFKNEKYYGINDLSLEKCYNCFYAKKNKKISHKAELNSYMASKILIELFEITDPEPIPFNFEKMFEKYLKSHGLKHEQIKN